MNNSDTSSQEFLSLSERFGLPIVDSLLSFPFVRERCQPLPYAFVKKKLLLPLEEQEGVLTVALSNPYALDALEEVRFLTGKEVKGVLCPQSLLVQAMEQCYQQADKEASEYIAGLEQNSLSSSLKNGEEEYDLFEKSVHPPPIQLLNMLLIEAIQQGASDIHFEPTEDRLVIRYRIDGFLHFRHSPPRDLQDQLITRIKVMAKMDIAERRLPQDGRIKLMMAGRQVDFRVSTVPVIYGERIVLRILDKSHIILGLDKLGMQKDILISLRRSLKQTQGIILVTGPTGSGKTTTLYGAISELLSDEVNIMTIEDPVEYKLPGIAQMGVHPQIGVSFARGLRHILRQDPDIIMIGEIRDKETAEIAMQSALTGHLVLSTLHTNDATSALTRLVDMGIEPYLLTSTILAVLAQRLVRKICPHCKRSYCPTEGELRDLLLDRGELEEGVLCKGEGCKSCLTSGYLGRCGIYEFLVLSPEIKNQLLIQAEATELKRLALIKGMRTLGQASRQLLLEGKTTATEFLRISHQIGE